MPATPRPWRRWCFPWPATCRRSGEGAVTTFEPNVRFSSFGDVGLRGTVQLRARSHPDQALVKHVFITRLHAAFKAQGIEIPTTIPPKPN